MAERALGVDPVVVPAADAAALEIAVVDQVGEHAVGLPLRQARGSGDLAHGRTGLARDPEQHEAVRGEEGPGRPLRHAPSLYRSRDASQRRAYWCVVLTGGQCGEIPGSPRSPYGTHDPASAERSASSSSSTLRLIGTARFHASRSFNPSSTRARGASGRGERTTK